MREGGLIMLSAESLLAVNQSYGRCTADPLFFDSFYENFMKSSPAIAAMFKNTDFKKQKEMLRSTITFVIMYAKDPAGGFVGEKLRHVGNIHSRGKLNVAPNMYPLWIESLLMTVKRHDKQCTPEVERSWRQVLVPAIDLLKSLY
jgi:hemoglobin-like flavoprotein